MDFFSNTFVCFGEKRGLLQIQRIQGKSLLINWRRHIDWHPIFLVGDSDCHCFKLVLIVTSTAYYATGPNLTLLSIEPPPQGKNLPVLRDIVHADLRRRKDRILNIRRLINLSGLIRTVSGSPALSGWHWIYCFTKVYLHFLSFMVSQCLLNWHLCRDYETLEIAGRSRCPWCKPWECGILKAYTMDNKFNLNRIFHLKNVYHLLQNENVPFVDRLLTTFNTTTVLSL